MDWQILQVGKKAAVTGAVACLLASPLAIAQEHTDHGSGKGQMRQQGKGSGTHGGSGSGHDVEGTIIHGQHGRDASILDESDEESDRPAWAGQPGGEGRPGGASGGKPDQAGTEKGDLFGDMWELYRDENGVPILVEINGEYYVQPVDADGNPIELDEEGHPVDEDATTEVELSRLNIGRAPDKVLQHAFDEAMAAIQEADEITTDISGRLVLYDADTDTTKTIDSPLENLALYIDAMTDGGELDSGIDWSTDQAAAFLAAAADKFGTASVDTVEYMNALLGIPGTLKADDGSTYVDYTDFTYNRDVFDTDVQVLQDADGDGTYTTTTVNLKDDVLGGDYSGSNVDAFAQMVDDSIQVIEYIHESYLPE
ncbi:MAG TPA: hypothetical protein VKA55_08925 [Gammaproteobacteria bacterium]|nr:hypothetical protein [Gammaproteobacteria bacterium]